MFEDRTPQTTASVLKTVAIGAIVMLIGLVALSQAARLFPKPSLGGHPDGTMTGPMFRWMLQVMAIGVGITTAAVIAGAKAMRSSLVLNHRHEPGTKRPHAA
jgi:hypothetical protein